MPIMELSTLQRTLLSRIEERLESWTLPPAYAAGYRVQRLAGLGQRVLGGGQVLVSGVQCRLGGGWVWVAYPAVRSARGPGRSDRFVFMVVMCAAVSVSSGSGRRSTRRECPELSAWLNPVATTYAHPLVSPASENSLTTGYVEPPVGIEPTTFSLRVRCSTD